MNRKITIIALSSLLVVASTGTLIALVALGSQPASAADQPGPSDPDSPDNPLDGSGEEGCDPCDQPTTATQTSTSSGGGGGGGGGTQQADACSALDLQAEPLEDGAIRLTWSDPGDQVRIYRSNGGPLALIATIAGTDELYVDTGVVGTEYAYELRPFDGQAEHEGCEVAITAVPVFGTLAATGLAIGIGLVAYAGARRRS